MFLIFFYLIDFINIASLISLVDLRKRSIDLGGSATYSKADVKLYISIDRKDYDYVNMNYWNYVPSIGLKKITSKNFMYRFRACLNFIKEILYVILQKT